jgi:hypothetical protein
MSLSDTWSGMSGGQQLGLAGMGVGLGLKAIGGVASYFQQRDAQKRLDALGRQALPQYSVNPAIARIYSGALGDISNPQGYSGAERANFQQNIGRGLNTQAANARAMGGGSMSRAISGVLSGNQLGQYNQFAAQDAGLARQNKNAAYSRLMGAANTMQGVDNQNIGMAANRRFQQENLLGQAIASQRAYRQNLLGGVGSDLTSAGTYGLMGYMDGNDSGFVPPRFNQRTANRRAGMYNFDGGNTDVNYSDVRK